MCQCVCVPAAECVCVSVCVCLRAAESPMVRESAWRQTCHGALLVEASEPM